jgi:hypothetical protein
VPTNLKRRFRSIPHCLVLLIALAGCGGGGGAGNTSSSSPKVGAVSYWALTSYYDQLPSGALALINPSDGIFTGQTQTVTPDAAAFAAIVANAATRNVSMLGYVPTGYFNHSCDIAAQCQTWARIEAQVQAYFQQLPAVAGIFFDETSVTPWDCNAFVAEFQQLRTIVNKYRSGARIAFNVADPTPCVVDAVAAGEILVQFEGKPANYLSRAAALDSGTAAARAKGVLSWHLVLAAADIDSVHARAAASRVDYFYATDKAAGTNEWNTLPTYWARELALMGY